LTKKKKTPHKTAIVAIDRRNSLSPFFHAPPLLPLLLYLDAFFPHPQKQLQVLLVRANPSSARRRRGGDISFSKRVERRRALAVDLTRALLLPLSFSALLLSETTTTKCPPPR